MCEVALRVCLRILRYLVPTTMSHLPECLYPAMKNINDVERLEGDSMDGTMLSYQKQLLLRRIDAVPSAPPTRDGVLVVAEPRWKNHNVSHQNYGNCESYDEIKTTQGGLYVVNPSAAIRLYRFEEAWKINRRDTETRR